MHNFVSMLDYNPADLADLIALAGRFKNGKAGADADALRNRLLVLVFFNPSLRTRTSFEAAMLRHGGHSICLNVAGDAWKLEHRPGVVMDGECAEHIKDAAPVLGRYGDILAVRTFAGLADAAQDAKDQVIRSFARFAGVPVVNLESAMEHPCQGMADWMTIQEKLGATRGKRFVLTWAPHVKGLPMAVPHSAVLSAAAAGMNVTIAHPPEYTLNSGILDRAAAWCSEFGTELSVTASQPDACRDADIVYVKSWASTKWYGDPQRQQADFKEHADWTVDVHHLGKQTHLMHCLPVRRNVVISDAALDDPRCIVVDQAENRMWTQAAVLSRLCPQ